MVLTAHRGLCVYCGRSAAVTIDHEEPIANEGADVWWNFVPACEDCNRWKKGRSSNTPAALLYFSWSTAWRWGV
ncbi:HNH endonuclease [Streptomyces nodosus]|uniref:HNH endonuclease n=1 Tax=Streptomyces nodosus TaxID=40318 RepID=UPI0036EA974B